MRFLFVCRANIGRSQMAYGFARNLLGEEHEIYSAGTITKRRGGMRLREVIENDNNLFYVMDEAGIDIRDQEITALTTELVKRANMVINMTEGETCPDYLLKCGKVASWNITDPNGQDLEFHREVRDRIYGNVRKLKKDLKKMQG